MNALNRLLGWISTAAASLALTACLISETPLLDASTGRATPFAAGAHVACQTEDDATEPECKHADVAYDDTGLYRFMVEDEESATEIRFRKISRGAWIAQLGGADDEPFFYFFAEGRDDGFILTMIVCEDIPGAVRDRYKKRGEMEVGDDASVCTAKSLRAVTAAARIYRGANAPAPRSQIIYSPVVAAGE